MLNRLAHPSGVDRCLQKKISLGALFVLGVIAACGGQSINLGPTRTPAPLTLPPTWTPNLAATAVPTFTEFPTFTPVPQFTQPAYPTNDSLRQLLEKFPETLSSRNGHWVAYRDPNKIRVVNSGIKRTWTLPCELFKECSILLPIQWSRDGQYLYFAPAPTTNGYPSGVLIFTSLGRINVRSGRWEKLLPDSDHYYDFTISPDEAYLAYTQSTGYLPGDPLIGMGILRLKNNKMEQQFTLSGSFAGNIVWSPYKYRFVFQTQELEKGSSIVYFDMESGVLKYIIRDEPYDFYMSAWGEDNLVLLQKTAWLNRAKSDWLLNPFTGETALP